MGAVPFHSVNTMPVRYYRHMLLHSLRTLNWQTQLMLSTANSSRTGRLCTLSHGDKTGVNPILSRAHRFGNQTNTAQLFQTSQKIYLTDGAVDFDIHVGLMYIGVDQNSIKTMPILTTEPKQKIQRVSALNSQFKRVGKTLTNAVIRVNAFTRLCRFKNKIELCW